MIIVGRGGGSIEDLWAFNEEQVARAIAASRAPVISAVGHEIDFTVADFVADVRAPTPTAAAEIAVPKAEDLSRRIRELDARIASKAAAQLRGLRSGLSSLLERRPFRRPLAGIHESQQQVDFLTERLIGACRRDLAARRRVARAALRELLAASPRAKIARLRTRTEGLRDALFRSAHHRQRLTRERFASLAHRLEAGSPLAVLARGYSICRRLPGLEVLREASAASAGDDVRVDLGKGHLLCGVREVRAEEGVLERA